MDKVDNIQSLVQRNTGSMDMVVLLSLGTAGDQICTELFHTLYPSTNPQQYNHGVIQLVRAVWASARKYHLGGQLFCIQSLLESCQTQNLADELVHILANPLNALNLLDTILSLQDCLSVGQFLANLTKNSFNTVIVKGHIELEGLQCILSANGAYEELIISANKMGDKDWKILSEHMSGSTALKRLTLSSCEPLAKDNNCLFQVKENKALRCLGLVHGQVDSHSLKHVCISLNNFQGLQGLDLTGNSLGGYTCHLDVMYNLAGLKYLTMQTCDLRPSDMTTLADIVLQNKLKWLDVSHNAIGGSGVSDLSGCLSHHTTELIGLGLVECHIDSVAVRTVCNTLVNNHKLKILGLSDNDIGAGALSVVEMVKKNSCLEELDVERCGFSTEQSCMIFSAFKYNQNLKRLSLAYNKFMSNVTFRYLCGDILNTEMFQLEALGLGKCGLSNETLKAILTCLKKNEKLKLINFGDNRSLSAETVVDVLAETHIQHIGMSKCFFGPEGWKMVGKALVDNPHVVSCMVGDGEEGGIDLVGFLHELCLYPATGPLKHLWLHANSADLAAQVCQLQAALCGRVSISFVKDAIAFYMLSGTCWSALPPDIRLWVSNTSMHCT